MKRVMRTPEVDYSDPRYRKAAKDLFEPSIRKLKKILSKADEYKYDEETKQAIRDAIDLLKQEYNKYK